MLKTLLQNKALLFALKLIVIFAVLSQFHVFYYGLAAPGGDFYSPFVEKYLNYPYWYRMFILHSSSFLLELFGNETIIMHPRLKMIGGSSVGIGYSCLGFGVMSFLVAFVIAYPSTIKEKLKFLPISLGVIVSLNVIRIAILAYAYSKFPTLHSIKINHHTVFNVIVYGLLFLMIYKWVNYLGKKSTTKS
jgi:exosortase/archaeosortase family protein